MADNIAGGSAFDPFSVPITARFRQKFILLAPTSANAAFSALDAHVNLTSNGTLQPEAPPRQLFAQCRVLVNRPGIRNPALNFGL